MGAQWVDYGHYQTITFSHACYNSGGNLLEVNNGHTMGHCVNQQFWYALFWVTTDAQQFLCVGCVLK